MATALAPLDTLVAHHSACAVQTIPTNAHPSKGLHSSGPFAVAVRLASRPRSSSPFAVAVETPGTRRSRPHASAAVNQQHVVSTASTAGAKESSPVEMEPCGRHDDLRQRHHDGQPRSACRPAAVAENEAPPQSRKAKPYNAEMWPGNVRRPGHLQALQIQACPGRVAF